MIRPAALCAALLLPSLSFAHESGGRDAKMRACKADAEKLCKDVKPGEGRIIDCLKEHEEELSAACRGAMKREGGDEAGRRAMEACKADKEKLCADVEPGEGRIVDCMRAHKDELSAACRAMMARKGDLAAKKEPRKKDADEAKPEGGKDAKDDGDDEAGD